MASRGPSKQCQKAAAISSKWRATGFLDNKVLHGPLRPGWPYEIVIKLPKMLPSHFSKLTHMYVICSVEKSIPNSFGYFCDFQKGPKVKNRPNSRKFTQSCHPVRGVHACHTHMYILWYCVTNQLRFTRSRAHTYVLWTIVSFQKNFQKVRMNSPNFYHTESLSVSVPLLISEFNFFSRANAYFSLIYVKNLNH
jgi:hypothetical protein